MRSTVVGRDFNVIFGDINLVKLEYSVFVLLCKFATFTTSGKLAAGNSFMQKFIFYSYS